MGIIAVWINAFLLFIWHKLKNMYANFAFLSHGQVCVYANFAYTQIEVCTWSRPSANFAYTQILHNYTEKWKNCGHMNRFAYVSKICKCAKFAYVSKSGHVTGT